MDEKKDIKYINPPNLLKNKVGSGGIDTEDIEEAQEIIESVLIDFAPYAENFITEIEAVYKELQTVSDAQKQKTLEKIIMPVMELKSNGAMFNYKIITDVARVFLYFLECLEEINNDALDLVNVHVQTLKTILHERIDGNTGTEGLALIDALDEACMRYFKKYNIDHEAMHKLLTEARQS